ncbi:MAG TPA: PAS domain-containing protein [Aliidongia sp.]|nr:PAS domain-containing protein [Aliidongia sp.]
MLPPAAQRILEAVGFDFLTRGGAVSITSADGQVLWANAPWHELAARMERALDDASAHLPWTLDELFQQADAAGRPVRREDMVRTMTGPEMLLSEHWLASSPTGERLGYASAVSETTQEGRFRRQIGALQDRLDDLTRLVSDWVWEVASDLTLSFVSARVTDVLGVHPREFVGKELAALGRFVGSGGEAIANPLIVPRPRPFRDVGFVMGHADGSPRRFKLSALPVFERGTGRFRGYRGTAHDVSPEASALDLAARSRTELLEAIDAIPGGFALFGADQHLLLANRQFHQILATGPADGAGPKMGSLSIRAANGAAFDYELADGRWIRITDRAMPDGRIVELRVEVTDLKGLNSNS